MQRAIEKFLIISLLGIFLFSVSIHLKASETSGARLQPSPATSSQKNGLTSSQSVIPPVGSTIAITSRADIIELLFGVIITIIGLLAVALALYRWKAFFQNEKDLITISHELETARQIQSFILPRETVNIKGLKLAAQYVPMAAVAGDFYDFIKVDDKRLGVLVADVSGHGVPASLISSMVKIAFSSQLPHAHNPARVLAGINQILCGKLESDFVTAAYLFIDTEKQMTAYAGAGHPPLLVWRGSEEEIYEYGERAIVLGQLEAAHYQNSDFSLKSGDRFILYTDGIIEATNAAGEFFGESRFKAYITSQARRSAGNFADEFIRHITDWSGKHLDDALDDDLTLVVVDYKNS